MNNILVEWIQNYSTCKILTRIFETCWSCLQHSWNEYWLTLIIDTWIILEWCLDDAWMLLGWYLDVTWMLLEWYLNNTWMILEWCRMSADYYVIRTRNLTIQKKSSRLDFLVGLLSMYKIKMEKINNVVHCKLKCKG